MLKPRCLRFIVLTILLIGLGSITTAQQPQSSNTTAIAYISPSRENQQIHLINPDGSNIRTIWNTPPDTPRENGIGTLSWRPNAAEITFDSSHDNLRSMHIRDIYAVTPDGNRLRRVTNSPNPDSVTGLPTGSVTLQVANNRDAAELEVYVEGATEPVRFLAATRTAYNVTFEAVADLGPDIRQYVRVRQLTPNSSGRLCHYALDSFADVERGQIITAGAIATVNDYHCPTAFSTSWQANGANITFLSREASESIDPPNNVWQIEASPPLTEIGERVLDMGEFSTTDVLYLVAMSPSLDTVNEMLMVSSDGLNTPIFRADIRDPEQATLVEVENCPRTACAVLGVAWLPDGRGFFFSRHEQGLSADPAPPEGGALYRYDFASGETTEILRLPDEVIGRITLSPDGQTMAFERGTRLEETVERVSTGPRLLCPCELWLVENDGTNTRLLVNDGRAPSWSPGPPQTTLPLTPRTWLPLIQR